MVDCTNPRADCSAPASVIHQPIFLLTAVQHSGLGEANVSWKRKSQKEPPGEVSQHSQFRGVV